MSREVTVTDRNGKSVFLRAIVRSNRDPDGLGRVKVSYPSFSGNSSEINSDWVQIVSPFASSEYGQWFLPEEGDEVLVALESTNIAMPIVMGTLYSSKRKPPTVGRGGDKNQDGKNTVKFIKTKAGNQLCFDDSSGKEEVLLEEKDGTKLKLKKDEALLSESTGAKLSLKNNKVALGNSSAELLDLIEQVLDVIQQNAATMVATAVGPGVLNPGVMAKIVEVKTKLGMLKGSL
jgi:uncharacterized protein involved in type VI secretion and phage assembly